MALQRYTRSLPVAHSRGKPLSSRSLVSHFVHLGRPEDTNSPRVLPELGSARIHRHHLVSVRRAEVPPRARNAVDAQDAESTRRS